ncbi:hypothetical protein B0T17DRAFT_502447 [Bombardia bombarda]|uniref:PRKR-interacting protein 1 n=1 Tax=Bombardia bombarda TaxID=252184 RepID=A0AA39XIW5_9PEZI|nr:hypothetical protein B0T17DRAFT_502447 [Bombardia bombarda]
MSANGPESIPTSADRRSKRPLKKARRALSPTSLQAETVQALFAKPDQEIRLPPSSSSSAATRKVAAPPEIVTNVQGSSAGAGSGEFHVYKAARRREYERLRAMDEEVAREREAQEFAAARREKETRDEERTRKNREKREKKMKAKQLKEQQEKQQRWREEEEVEKKKGKVEKVEEKEEKGEGEITISGSIQPPQETPSTTTAAATSTTTSTAGSMSAPPGRDPPRRESERERERDRDSSRDRRRRRDYDEDSNDAGEYDTRRPANYDRGKFAPVAGFVAHSGPGLIIHDDD